MFVLAYPIMCATEVWDMFTCYFSSVNIAMEALDTLLVTCHAQSLNLFVESFLKMVQKLLECSEVDLQCLATASVCMAFWHLTVCKESN